MTHTCYNGVTHDYLKLQTNNVMVTLWVFQVCQVKDQAAQGRACLPSGQGNED